jgi:hypothetical protein
MPDRAHFEPHQDQLDARPYVALLLAADDWRPLSEYVPSEGYVYVKGFSYMAR